MDLSQIWNEAVKNVINATPSKEEQAVIGLFPYQITIQITETNVEFICANAFVSQQFPKYAYTLLVEVQRLVGNDKLGMVVKSATDVQPAPTSSPTPSQILIILYEL